MMKKFRMLILGGDTDKRESSWFAFLLWVAGLVIVCVLESRNIHMGAPTYNLEFPKEILKLAMWPVFGWWSVAHGLEFVNKQTVFGADHNASIRAFESDSNEKENIFVEDKGI